MILQTVIFGAALYLSILTTLAYTNSFIKILKGSKKVYNHGFMVLLVSILWAIFYFL